MEKLTTLDQKSSNQILPPNCVLASPTKRFWAEMVNALIFGWPILAIRQDPEFTWISKDDLYIIPITVITSAIFYPFFLVLCDTVFWELKWYPLKVVKIKNQFFLEFIVSYSNQYWGIL